MLQRITTGIFLAIVVSLSVSFLPLLIIKSLVLILTAACAYEAATMILPRHPSSSVSFAVLLTTIFSSWLLWGQGGVLTWWILCAALIFVCFVFYLLRRPTLDLVLDQVSRSIFVIFYVGLLFSCLAFLLDLPEGRWWLFVTLACTFAADTGGYLAGRLWGRNKLAPRVSPGKTVEGLLGGIFLSGIAALIFKFLVFKELSWMDGLCIALLAGLIGPLGDLSESMLKRSVGVKDSSHLIPGHGGLLDRVDALLFTAPAIYAYLFYWRY